MIRERDTRTLPGLPAWLLLFVVVLGVLVYTLVNGATRRPRPCNRRLRRSRSSLERLPDGRPVRGQPERRPRAAAVRRLRRHRRRRPGCAGRTRSTPRSASRCACATSRARGSRSTTTTATRSRSPRSWCGGRRHGRGGVRGRRLPELRQGAERGGGAQPRDELHVRRARRSADVAARPHRRSRRAPEEGDPGPAGHRPASR